MKNGKKDLSVGLNFVCYPLPPWGVGGYLGSFYGQINNEEHMGYPSGIGHP